MQTRDEHIARAGSAVVVAGLMFLSACTSFEEDAEPTTRGAAVDGVFAQEANALPRLDAATLAGIRRREQERAGAARATRLGDPTFRLPEGGDLRVEHYETDELGVTHTLLQVTVDRIPLQGMEWMEHTRPGGEVERPTILDGWTPPVLVRSSAKMTKEEAIRLAQASLEESQDARTAAADLYYVKRGSPKSWELVYVIDTVTTGPSGPHTWRQLVRVGSGEVLETGDGLQEETTRAGTANAVEADAQCSCRQATVRRDFGTCGDPSDKSYLCVQCFTNGGHLEEPLCANTAFEAGIECQTRCTRHANRGECGFPN